MPHRFTAAAILFALASAALGQVVHLPSYPFNGDSVLASFGLSVSGAGDVNGDGFDDFIVGAPTQSNADGVISGNARVLSGADGSLLYTFDGDAENDDFGSSVSGAGDVNNDGFDDLIVGARFNDGNGVNSGNARVFSGADGSILYDLYGESANGWFGDSVSGAGDVDGDGFDDVIVGAPTQNNADGVNTGNARVFSGADGSLLYTFSGDSAGDSFGISVSGAGDVNGDGFDDLIVGAFRDDNNGEDSGSARIFSGLDGSILYTFHGDSADDLFGWSVSGAGDVNSDGSDDLIVGAYDADGNGFRSGMARVFSGANGSILYTFNGDSDRDDFGYSVSGAGDVNGDGFDDLIVGDFRDDNNLVDSGSARVFSGATGSVLYTFNGDSAADSFGISVSGAGDVNGDGFDDLIVGAFKDDNNGTSSGSARVFLSYQLPAAPTPCPGDADGDDSVNFTDLNLVLSNFSATCVSIAGASGQVDHLPNYPFYGDAADEWLGGSVSGAGDVNNDGFDDLIVGARFANSGEGIARVFSGADGAILYTFYGDSASDLFGISVSGAGDVNNDGFDDLIVGAEGDDNHGPGSGSAEVFSGADGSILHTFNGDSPRDNLGETVSGAGDVNNDGFDDVIVGALNDDNNGVGSGSARVFSGDDGSILYTFNGDSASDFFGVSVSGAGDVNGDGFDDLIVGARDDDNNGSNSGSARVFSGADGAILYTFNGDSNGDQFGVSVSGAGDVNGDGYDDLFVGATHADNQVSDSGSARVFYSYQLPAAPEPCAGDLNGDNIVNFSDLNTVLSNFGAPCD